MGNQNTSSEEYKQGTLPYWVALGWNYDTVEGVIVTTAPNGQQMRHDDPATIMVDAIKTHKANLETNEY